MLEETWGRGAFPGRCFVTTTMDGGGRATTIVAQTPEELDRAFRECTVSHRQSHYVTLVLIRRMEACAGYKHFGCVNLQQYIELVCQVSGVSARERIRVAFALARLPQLDQAMAEGRLSYSKLRAVTRVANSDNEVEWLQAALEHTAEELDTLVARSQRGKPRPSRLFTRPIDEHTTRLIAEMPTEDVEVIIRAIDRVRKESGGLISKAQALVYVAADQLAGDPGQAQTADRYTVVIHAGADGGAWVETDQGDAPVRKEVVERLLCDCAIRLAQETSDAGGMAVSKRQRSLPSGLRRSVELRDRQRCRVPGCRNRLWLDVHHIVPKSKGGRHTRKNLVLLCTQHHQLVHDGYLSIEVGAKGPRFISSTGWEIGNVPAGTTRPSGEP